MRIGWEDGWSMKGLIFAAVDERTETVRDFMIKTNGFFDCDQTDGYSRLPAVSALGSFAVTCGISPSI